MIKPLAFLLLLASFLGRASADIPGECRGCTGQMIPGTLVCGDDDYEIGFELTDPLCGEEGDDPTDPSGKCHVDAQGNCVQEEPCKYWVLIDYGVPVGEKVKVTICWMTETGDWECATVDYTGEAEPRCSAYQSKCGENQRWSFAIGDCSNILNLVCTKCTQD